MSRLNIERQNELEPKRVVYAIEKIREAGCTIVDYDDTKVVFKFKGHNCTLFPYSGWHTGKTIKDGLGIENLLKQLQ